MLTRAREEKGKEGTVDQFIYIVNYTPPKKIISAIGSKFVIAAFARPPYMLYTYNRKWGRDKDIVSYTSPVFNDDFPFPGPPPR